VSRRFASVQEVHVRLDDINGGVVRLTTGQLRSVLAVSSVSLGLRGETGQEALLAGYAGFLNTLTYPTQTLIRVLPVDIDGYLARLDRRARFDLPPALAEVAHNTAAYLHRKASQRTLLDRDFYCVVPADAPARQLGWWPFGRKRRLRLDEEAEEAARKQLGFRCEEITRQLARCGLSARQLTGDELLDLFHACFNADVAGLERARLEHGDPTALVVQARRPDATTAASPLEERKVSA